MFGAPSGYYVEKLAMSELAAPRVRGLMSLPLGVLFFILTSHVESTGSSCPSDLKTRAHTCFTGYSREYQNMNTSPKRLCCGVDVETLRAFCSSYMAGVNCIASLKKTCPESKHVLIDRALTNLHGAEDALKPLCRDDRIIEVYARHQSCFTMAGPKSEQCLQRHLNTSIRLLANVETDQMNKFCSDMRNAMTCIQDNIRHNCRSDEAVALAAVLVKPMVRQSAQCDYSHVTQSPFSGHNEHGGMVSARDGRQYASGSRSLGSAVTSFMLCTCVLVLSVVRTFESSVC